MRPLTPAERADILAHVGAQKDDALMGTLYVSGNHFGLPAPLRELLAEHCECIAEDQKITAMTHPEDQTRRAALENVAAYGAKAVGLRLSLQDELEIEVNAELAVAP